MKSLFLCLLGLAALAPAMQATVLSGAAAWASDSAGAGSSTFWNTAAPDGWWNLYLTQANSGATGPFVNSGNTAGSAAINLDLSTPGTYTFHFLAEGAAGSGFYGLNLFFNGNGTNPGISVLGVLNGGAFTANGNSNTRTLGGSSIAGSNSLTFLDGPNTVTLTDFAFYQFSSTLVPQLNRVGAFDNTPTNATLDERGYFTLQVNGPPVSETPEPSTWLLLGTSLGLLPFTLKRRR
jgi:hypothetical protein